MSFTFRRAVRETTSTLIALAGASGSGKTYTAICLGLGLAYPGMSPDEIMAAIEKEGRARVLVIDSEGGRALHYAPKPGEKPDFKDNFPFEYVELTAPFTPQAYQEVIVSANDAGFEVIITDSMSHEYEGEGGILEWADRLAAGVPKPGIENPEPWKNDHWIEKPVKSPGNWKEPKRAHKRMVTKLLQCRAHMIFCLRAEEKMLLMQEKFTGQNGKERTAVKVVPAEDRPVNERWEPICEKRFMYEMTVSFVLVPGEPGVGIPIKLQEQHRACFPDGQHINSQSGSRLAAWASGGSAEQAQSPADADEARERRQAWVDGYIEKVKACETTEDLVELQTDKAEPLRKIREGDAAQWALIEAAHNQVIESTLS